MLPSVGNTLAQYLNSTARASRLVRKHLSLLFLPLNISKASARDAVDNERAH